MSNLANITVAGSAPILSKATPHLLAPTVDGILSRFNNDDQRAEASLSAVVVLQAMKAMGMFAPPVASATLGTFAQPAPGQRPVLTGELGRRLEEELRKPSTDDTTRS